MEVGDIKGRVDFGIITIREDEFEAVLDRFPEDLGIVSGRRQYNVRRIAPNDPYAVAIVRCAVQANSEAQQVANALLDDLEPRWLLVVGIGGGAPASEFTLGDVVVATQVCDFNVGAVLKDGSHEYALHGWMSHPDVAKLAANLPAMRKQLGPWNSAESVHCGRPAMKISPKSLYGDVEWKNKIRKTLEHHLTEGRQEPRVTAGAIACSDLVMKDAELFQVWLKFTRQVIAVEMESAGVHKAAQERHVPFMSIRGLSDIVGFSRDPKWTAYACHSAAAFTRAFLLTRPIRPSSSKKDAAPGMPQRSHGSKGMGTKSPRKRVPKAQSREQSESPRANVLEVDPDPKNPAVESLLEPAWGFEPVPKAAVRIFRMAWQLEVWLRLIVYVELRAGRADWETPIKEFVGEWPPRSQATDKRLHHMATAHQAGISYLSFGQLWRIIIDDKNWGLFDPYFPPKHNAVARMEEVQAIRNRVAHFREPHVNDEARLELLLRDFDNGIRRFCLRYALEVAPEEPPTDPVSALLLEHWKQWGRGFELHGPHGWLYASEPYRHDPYAHAELSVHVHQMYQRGTAAGIIYRLHMSASHNRTIDIGSFLQATKGLHSEVLHIEVPSEHAVNVVLPAVAGATETAKLMAAFLDCARNSIGPGGRAALLRRLRPEWPEYVLWPNHPLCFYRGDETESIIRLD